MKVISQQKRPTPTAHTPKPTYQQNTRFAPQTTRTLTATVTPTTTTTTTSSTRTLPTSTLLSTATGTHVGPMDVSSVRRGPLTNEEKERQNKLGLCRYCGQSGHIAMDHNDANTLRAKRHATGIHEMTMALSNTAPSNNTSENTPSPSTVAVRDLLD